MSDLISRQAVLDELEKWDWQDLYLPIHFKQILDDIPSVENKGEWTRDSYNRVICSYCGEPRRDNRIGHINFCNCCGCDMGGE